MSKSILILGESGTGKSSAIRTLNPAETLIINVVGKPLPFRGANSKYIKLSQDGSEGNYYSSDEHLAIMRVIKLVNTKRLDIKNLIIDDFGYTITNSFMRKATQTGYQKYTELGLDAFNVLDTIGKLRDDLFCFVMMHTDIDQQGRFKPKTVGKMIDQHICIEGKFSYVYHALVSEGNYRFLTNNDGQYMAKTPMGMHEELFVDNDLNLITEKINEYDN